MTIEEAILDKVRSLPPDKQRSVLDFAETLTGGKKEPLRSPEGLWAHLKISISEEDVAEIRREMWKNFPREDL